MGNSRALRNQPRGRVRNAQRDGAHGFQVLGDVLSHLPVSPGGSPDKQAVFILQRHRQPVHLGLHIIAGFRHHTLHPLVKLPQLLIVKHILEGFQRNSVDYLLKGVQRLSPHPLGRGIGCDGLRVGRLQLLQPAQLVIVVVVGHGGLVQHIVLIARPGQPLPQRLKFQQFVHFWLHSLVLTVKSGRRPGKQRPKQGVQSKAQQCAGGVSE